MGEPPPPVARRGHPVREDLAPLDDGVFLHDDPIDELSATWGIKEQVRRPLKATTLDATREERMYLGCYVEAAIMAEADRLQG